MPIFEYACRDCGQEYEVLIRGSEAPVCPACGSAEAEKKLSTFAAHGASGPDLPCGDGACEAPSACAGGKCPFA